MQWKDTMWRGVELCAGLSLLWRKTFSPFSALNQLVRVMVSGKEPGHSISLHAGQSFPTAAIIQARLQPDRRWNHWQCSCCMRRRCLPIPCRQEPEYSTASILANANLGTSACFEVN